MNIRTLLAACFAAALVPAQDTRATVLFLTHSAGFVHDVVHRPAPDQDAPAEAALRQAMKGRFEIRATQDCGEITAERLRSCAAVVFYTTGELPIAPEGQRALIDYVWHGGGFVGIHPATDTFYKFPDYVEMIGGTFNQHPWHQKIRVLVDDATHPATHHLGEPFEITDEIYQFKNWDRAAVRSLLRLDPTSVDAKLGARADGDYSLAWCKSYGQGRVFYAALGHRTEVWQDPRYLAHVAGALEWAAGRTDWNAPAPKGAVTVFDGTSVAALVHRDGKPAGWKVADGALEVVPGSGDLLTREAFGDCHLHVEFATPRHPPTDRGQARGNSGVYLQDRYEVQVLDSFGLASQDNDCGAIYGKHAPRVNACLEPEVWQTYDILFRAPTWDSTGKKSANAHLTVWQNGRLIQQDVEVDGPTTAGSAEGAGPGPIRFQDHGCKVRYRRLWIERR